MITETIPEMVAVSDINVYGAGDLNRLPGNRFEYKGEVGREIVDFNTRYADLQDTITLRDQATLFQAYLLSQSGQLQLEDNVLGVLDYLFNETGRGNITNDACDYDNGDESMRRVHDSDRRVLWKVRPERFEETPEGWKAIGGEEYSILVPEKGFVRWTSDGGYRPDTGTPFETGSEEEAIQSMVDHGIPEEVAKRTRSYFWSRGENNGTATVGRYSSKLCGPLDVSANRDPSYMNMDIGRLPSSKSPSGARQADRRRFNSLVDELEGFVTRLKDISKE